MTSRKRVDSFNDDQLSSLERKLSLLLATAPEDEKPFYSTNFTGFSRLYRRFLTERKEPLVWDEITPLREGFILESSATEVGLEDAKVLLDKLVVVKLNGGLGEFTVEFQSAPIRSLKKQAGNGPSWRHILDSTNCEILGKN